MKTTKLLIISLLVLTWIGSTAPVFAKTSSSQSFPTRLICQQMSGIETLEMELSENKSKLYEGYLYSGPNKSQTVVFAPKTSWLQRKSQGVVMKGSGNLQMELAIIKEIVVGGFSQPGKIVLQTSKTIKNKVFDHCWMTWTRLSGRLDQVEI